MGTDKQISDMSDLACTRCRERKIRCGRERPHCRSCEREEGVVCVYQNPVKRVNHLKLLCDSVELLQQRLTSIESHLSRLHARAESADPESSGLRSTAEAEDSSTPRPALHGREARCSSSIEHFLQHVDCQTDVFDPQNLRHQLDRVYEEHDDVWAICFKTITLIVLGLEITHAGTLIGDFARSLLPNRAALVSSRVLTTSRLVNVQTLILLSVAAQQFDPPGWAELIFANACLIARTMGLHSLPITANESMCEQAKVFQALYIRDRRLCISRGAPSWLPSMEYKLTVELTDIASNLAYRDQFRLAIIQDGIHAQAHTAAGVDAQSLEKQLDHFINRTRLLQGPMSSVVSRSAQALEFLATRILAFEHGPETYAAQARSDARASCLLVLMAYGDRGQDLQDEFQELVRGVENEVGLGGSPDTFFTALDAFSLPGVFILLNGLVQRHHVESESTSITNLDLLHRLSACYAEQTAWMPSTHYHRRVSWILDQLLLVIDMIQNPQDASTCVQGAITHLSSDRPEGMRHGSDTDIVGPWPPGDSSATSLTWDTWLSSTSPLGPSSLGPPTPIDPTRVVSPDLLTQMLAVSQGLDGVENLPWTTVPETSGRKRRRTDDPFIPGSGIFE
ncbi:uncharacterized protein LDX57_002704 [Aspergillus melleus]|uniref:uncharacterized protein n=1 Tax=Aspergillus melleus TaxID=138277 RepID=UPI001E8CF254|nr:uncharacterized protein LDX57_002704 [Aspergillus melleus]KAH8424958.1 hypothetical protein LDX57_002704 [Aspergillus melleus]